MLWIEEIQSDIMKNIFNWHKRMQFEFLQLWQSGKWWYKSVLWTSISVALLLIIFIVIMLV